MGYPSFDPERAAELFQLAGYSAAEAVRIQKEREISQLQILHDALLATAELQEGDDKKDLLQMASLIAFSL